MQIVKLPLINPSGKEVIYSKVTNDLEDFSILGSPCLVSRELGFMMTS